MTSTIVDTGGASTGIVSINVRTILGLDHEKLKVRWVNMRNVPPAWDHDAREENRKV